MKKYEFTGETKALDNEVALHRIRALRDFGDVKAGDLGGWIERESNLSHKGNCWVFDDAWVFGNAEVYGNAWVHGDALVYSYASLRDDTRERAGQDKT